MAFFLEENATVDMLFFVAVDHSVIVNIARKEY